MNIKKKNLLKINFCFNLFFNEKKKKTLNKFNIKFQTKLILKKIFFKNEFYRKSSLKMNVCFNLCCNEIKKKILNEFNAKKNKFIDNEIYIKLYIKNEIFFFS